MNHKYKMFIISLVMALFSVQVYAQLGPKMGRVGTVALKKTTVPKLVNARVPRVTGTTVSAKPLWSMISTNTVISAPARAVRLEDKLDLYITSYIAANEQPLIMNTQLLQEATSTTSSSKVTLLRTLMNQTWSELLKSTDWNYREALEAKLSKHHLSFDVQDTILDVLTLEQYILHKGKWPRNMEDPQEMALSKNISAALLTNYKDYVVALRKRVNNVPTADQTISQAEKFVSTRKRIPGVVYLQSQNTDDLPFVSAEEKLLGQDLHFLVETNIASSLGQENASLARLRDWWDCYADIYFASGIPEFSSEGKPNIPVLSTAQWQSKLDRWTYSQPVRAVLYPTRPYQYFVTAHQKKGESEEQAADFGNWNQMEKEEALLAAAQILKIKAPILTKEQWDASLANWIEAMDIPRYEITTEGDHPIVKTFKELDPFEQLEVVFGNIYHLQKYPEQFAKELREKGELE